MKQTLLTNWHLMRILRLVLGGFVMYDGFKSHQYLFMFFGAAFMGMALFNIGCCGPQGCSIPESKNTDPLKDEDIVFEEVK
jgi:hypothetical protein